MKSKLYSIIFMALFLLVAGAFYYEGAPENVAANQEPVLSNESMQLEMGSIDEKNLESEKAENPKEIQKEITKKQEAKKVLNEKIKETNEEKENEKVIETDTEPIVEEEDVLEDSIEIGGYQYVNFMDVAKFQHLINVANNYDSKLYAVPNTDLFAIVKNGEPIFHKSTGFSSAPISSSALLKDVFNGDGFIYNGIPENIDFVSETSAKVTVEFEQRQGYSIYLQDGWIVVSW
ncbi:hypothetical protein [Cytobacillus firmus]|uniref:hypothetical protein n=1 Tax=Cytobacillus firmus TaxID=1399 RepID=UPI001C8DC8B9|nr:hypothetical protein [Cytobacillus firmus]MBX9974435.1 hypothetical protein [Cytobacillus firmus]